MQRPFRPLRTDYTVTDDRPQFTPNGRRNSARRSSGSTPRRHDAAGAPRLYRAGVVGAAHRAGHRRGGRGGCRGGAPPRRDPRRWPLRAQLCRLSRGPGPGAAAHRSRAAPARARGRPRRAGACRGSGLERARAQGVPREVRPGAAGYLGAAGTASTLFAVSWLFVGSYPCGHGRRARDRIQRALNKPSYMSAADVRSAFLEFFRGQSHIIVPSSSLVPANDPTLLFTNAGMVQFKDVFLGKEQRDYLRAATAQRCLRAGGKHNDLENVGYTARHHTFFEMLGNFSFGDYFKREAIHLAWDFLIYTLRLDPARLWCTVYKDDDEAADVWLKDIGVSPERFARLGEASNFWAMGDTGPCGPCSEIFFDHGPGVAGGPPGSEEEEGDRYVEIWNLVFMQFDREADGTLKPLPRPSVDTGMGLERITAVMQGVHSNYEIDLFKNLIRAAGKLAGTSVLTSNSLRVIADHIRAATFLVVDGVLPFNEGRGYVLRRIIRRAIRHGYKLGIQQPFFYKLVRPLEQEMGTAYPELTRGRALAERVLKQEEEQFARTLANGMVLLESAIRNLRGARIIDGDTVFKLHDTFGFPVDLTADVARERGLSIDQARFEAAMAEQRRRSQEASKFAVDLRDGSGLESPTLFSGYEGLSGPGRVVTLLKQGAQVEALEEGEAGEVVLDRTPFYAEAGGQVGDAGHLTGSGVRFAVADTQKRGAAHAHLGEVADGTIRVGDTLEARVDAGRRQATVLNHTATHLLHAALRQVLGTHVQQK